MMRQTAIALLLAPIALHAQPDIRVNVDLGQIEVVVTDSKGRRVPGLSIEDFRLTLGGRERAISALSYVDGATEAVGRVNGLLRRDDVRRAIVFMVDETHTSPENFGQLVPVVRRFVDEQMGPRDLVSVMATRNNLGFFERFTSHKQQVRAALDRVTRLVGQSYDHINDQRPSQYDRPGLITMASAFMMEAYHGLAMAAIERALAGLRDMPGRKAVVLMSDGIEFPLEQLNPKIGFPSDPDYVMRMKRRTREVVALASQSGVVFYTFDTKTADASTLSAVRRANLQTVPYMLAQETGGIFTHDTNGLTEALGKAMEDMTGYYLLGFTPSPDEVHRDAADLLSQRVRIAIRRPGLNARTRSSIRLTASADRPPLTREETMRRAILSPFAAGAMRLRLTPVYSASPPDPRTGQRRPLVRVLLAIDGRDLTWQTAAAGKKTAVLDVAVAAFAADNKAVGNQDQRYTIEATEAQAAALAAADIPYALDLGPLRPGPYQIRAAVRDDASGGAGSAGAFLELPDFNRRALTMSSIVLSESPDPKANRRRVEYACRVYGARTEKGATQVELEVRLLHDGRQIFAGAPIPLIPDPGASEINVVGSIALPADLPNGDYTVQVIARDRLAGAKPATASQSADLALRPRPGGGAEPPPGV